MIEQKPLNEEYMETIANMVKKKRQAVQLNDVSVSKIYETMNMVMSDLDTSIQECKKYNEAKIHRKYEIIIADLRSRIKFLQEKVKEEHRARSPSKNYVEDLLDKLIKYKFQTEAFNKRIAELQQENEEIKAKIKIYEEDGAVTNKKESEVDESALIAGPVLYNEVSNFLKLKQSLRRHEKLDKTSFQRFLKKVEQKLSGWSMRQFLQATEKWTQDYYENDMKMSQMKPKSIQTVSEHRKTANNKLVAVSFRLRNHRRESQQQILRNNLTLYDNILR